MGSKRLCHGWLFLSRIHHMISMFWLWFVFTFKYEMLLDWYQRFSFRLISKHLKQVTSLEGCQNTIEYITHRLNLDESGLQYMLKKYPSLPNYPASKVNSYNTCFQAGMWSGTKYQILTCTGFWIGTHPCLQGYNQYILMLDVYLELQKYMGSTTHSTLWMIAVVL